MGSCCRSDEHIGPRRHFTTRSWTFRCPGCSVIGTADGMSEARNAGSNSSFRSRSVTVASRYSPGGSVSGPGPESVNWPFVPGCVVRIRREPGNPVGLVRWEHDHRVVRGRGSGRKRQAARELLPAVAVGDDDAFGQRVGSDRDRQIGDVRAVNHHRRERPGDTFSRCAKEHRAAEQITAGCDVGDRERPDALVIDTCGRAALLSAVNDSNGTRRPASGGAAPSSANCAASFSGGLSVSCSV